MCAQSNSIRCLRQIHIRGPPSTRLDVPELASPFQMPCKQSYTEMFYDRNGRSDPKKDCGPIASDFAQGKKEKGKVRLLGVSTLARREAPHRL